MVGLDAGVTDFRPIHVHRVKTTPLAKEPPMHAQEMSFLGTTETGRTFFPEVAYQSRIGLRPDPVLGIDQSFNPPEWFFLTHDLVTGVPDRVEARRSSPSRKMTRQHLESQSLGCSKAKYSLRAMSFDAS